MNHFLQLTRDVPLSAMIGSSDEIQLLQNLIRVIGGKNCIDVGKTPKLYQ